MLCNTIDVSRAMCKGLQTWVLLMTVDFLRGLRGFPHHHTGRLRVSEIVRRDAN